MMNASRPSIMLLGVSVSAFIGAAGFLLWPSLASSDARTAECGRLLSQAARHDEIAAQRDRLRLELEDGRARAERVLRVIPPSADQAHLMRMLAVGTSDDVGTQTIVAGDPVPATPAGSRGLHAVPVTVDMKATFARVMDVLARAEGDRRLVRPIRIEIARPAEGKDSRRADGASSSTSSNLVEARIELDAVFSTNAAAGAAGEGES
jgi:hypothetical protein